jgi:dienelactone hydrolase
VPVHFYYPEGNDTGTDQFPLLVFSHGAFGYYQSNTSTYMELASNGYVVVSLDHPHHAFFTQDTDGRTILADGEFLNEAMNLKNEMAPEKQFALYTEWMALRTADMNFAVDELKLAGRQDALDDSWFLADADADRIQAILQRTDFSKIGLMGHSMGGATSVALGRERNDISAVIDIDGTMLSEYTGVENGELIVREEAYDCPVLEFINWESYNDQREYRAQGGRYPNDILMQQAAAGFTTTIRDTGHMDFTDLPLLSPFLGNMLGSGERDTAETMTIVNSLVLQFFNCYLKGEGTFSIEEVY